jgi:hypothetical protein
MPSQALATALLDTLARQEPPVPRTYESLCERIEQQPSGRLRTLLQVMFREGETDLAEVEKRLAQWFDAGMDRIIGRYKQLARRRCLIVSLVLAFLFQIDAVTAAHLLWEDAAARENLELVKAIKQVEPAKPASDAASTTEPPLSIKTHSTRTTDVTTTTDPPKAVDSPPEQSKPADQNNPADKQQISQHTRTVETIDTEDPSRQHSSAESHKACLEPSALCLQPSQTLLNKLENFNFDSVTSYLFNPCNHFQFSFVIGCLITALAAGFAAPFWFQILQKLIDFRGAGPAPKDEGGGGGAEPLIGALRTSSASWIVAAAAAGGTALAVTGTLALSPDATVRLAPGSTVSLAQGNTIGLAPGTMVKLASDTIKLEPGTTVNMVQGATVGLVGGSKVTLADGGKVSIDGGRINFGSLPSLLNVQLAGKSEPLNNLNGNINNLSPQITGRGERLSR